MSFNIEVESGTSVRLPTKGKYCDRDIVVTSTGGDIQYEVWTITYIDGTIEEKKVALL